MTSTFLLFQIYKQPTNELIVIITSEMLVFPRNPSRAWPASVRQELVRSKPGGWGGINKLNSTPFTEVQVIDEDVDSVDAVVIAAK